MKAILKTLSSEHSLKPNETFTSETNTEIRQKLVPELIKALKPRYNPSYEQINTWLQALHKHRRSRYNYGQRGILKKDNRRLHNNNRLHEV